MSGKVLKLQTLTTAAATTAVIAIAQQAPSKSLQTEEILPSASEQAWQPKDVILQLKDDGNTMNWPCEQFSDQLDAMSAAGVDTLIQIPAGSPLSGMADLPDSWDGHRKSHAPAPGLQVRAQQVLNEIKTNHGSYLDAEAVPGPQDYIALKWRDGEKAIKLGIFDDGEGLYTCEWTLDFGKSRKSGTLAPFSVSALVSAVEQYLKV